MIRHIVLFTAKNKAEIDGIVGVGVGRIRAGLRLVAAVDVELPFFLANHLPMVLIALHRMGADDARLEAYCHIYHEKNGLVPVPGPIGTVTRDNWREFLGQREREGDCRLFFTNEVARLGETRAATVLRKGAGWISRVRPPDLNPAPAVRLRGTQGTASSGSSGDFVEGPASVLKHLARRRAARRRQAIRSSKTGPRLDFRGSMSGP